MSIRREIKVKRQTGKKMRKFLEFNVRRHIKLILLPAENIDISCNKIKKLSHILVYTNVLIHEGFYNTFNGIISIPKCFIKRNF